MDQNLIANLLSLTLFFVALFIALRAFVLYAQVRGNRLCILGISMSVIALTAIASYVGDNVTAANLNVDWFKYIAQSISFLFICLSLARGSADYQRKVLRWQLVVSGLLLLLLLLAPVLPDFPNPPVTKTLLGGSRAVICYIIFFFYVVGFVSKERLFSLLMSASFLLQTVGYVLAIPKYSDPSMLLLDQAGDSTRIVGLIIMLAAVFLG